jgi:uncharacterized protein (TIGR02271 family)
MAKNVVGLFDTRNDAEAAIRDLRDSGFNSGDISFVGNNANNQYSAGDSGYTSTGDSEASEGAGFGATGGAVLGGLAGLLVGLGAIAIPGVGPAVAAGTLATTLGSTALGAGIGAAAGGLVGALVGAGIPEEDANVYAEGIRRGGALVSVQVATDDDADRAANIMDRHNVVDIDERGSTYRQSGWSGFDESASTYSGSGYGDADRAVGADDYDRSSKVGTAGGGLAGAATGAAIGSAGGPVGAVVGGVAGALSGGAVGAAGDAAGAEATDDHADRGSYDTSSGRAGTAYGSATTNYDTTGTNYSTTNTGYNQTGSTNLEQSGELKVPIVEEELRVGKREVESGGVRVNTRIEETPVNEQVTLREETVDVHRRPVDRPVSDADIANFQEGTFEVRERDEQAIVDKQARVVEEVHIKKNVEQRTENIQDTVRRTDVDVEQIGRERSIGSTDVDYTGTSGTTGYNQTGSNEGTIERGTSKLGNAAERATGADLDRDGDVGQRDPRNNY